MRRATLLMIILSALLSAPVGAQNVVMNGGFDTNIDGWRLGEFPEAGYGQLSWDPLDANGSPSSGSIQLAARANPNIGGFESVNATQCISGIEANRYYAFGATIRLVSTVGRPDLYEKYIGPFYYTDSNCQGTPLSPPTPTPRQV